MDRVDLSKGLLLLVHRKEVGRHSVLLVPPAVAEAVSAARGT